MAGVDGKGTKCCLLGSDAIGRDLAKQQTIVPWRRVPEPMARILLAMRRPFSRVPIQKGSVLPVTSGQLRSSDRRASLRNPIGVVSKQAAFYTAAPTVWVDQVE